jgi:hypothetical protein
VLICNPARGLGGLTACFVRAAGRGTRGYFNPLIGEPCWLKPAGCRPGDSMTGVSIAGLSRLSSSWSGVVSSSVSKVVASEPAESIDPFLAVVERLSA